jgi:preprotein translocase subunit SecD
MEQASDLIRQRIDRLGVAEPDVRVQGTDQIVVQIPASRTRTRSSTSSAARPSSASTRSSPSTGARTRRGGDRIG